MKPLLIIGLLLSACCDILCDKWSVDAPRDVKGVEGSCLVIPCTFQYAIQRHSDTLVRIAWLHEDKIHGNQVINSSGPSDPQFQGRTKFLGDWKNNRDCTLQIDNLQQMDQGLYHFRMEVSYGHKYSDPVGVTIEIANASSMISISPMTEIKEGKEVTIVCSVKFLCPGFLQWSNFEGLNKSTTSNISETKLNGWTSGCGLSFIPSYKDNERTLSCGIRTAKGEVQQKIFTLNVQYAPKLVYIESSHYSPTSDPRSVSLTCMVTSSNPPVSNYAWKRVTARGVLTLRPSKTLSNLQDRDTYRCEASNSVGRTTSDDVSIVTLRNNNWGVWSPLVLKVWEGSCVIIPCQFSYPETEQRATQKIGMWLKGNNYDGIKVFHNKESNNVTYRQRVEFLGSMNNKNCTLKINNLTANDNGKYYFRIEMSSDKWSQKSGSRLLVSETPEKPVISPMEGLVEEKVAELTCSFETFCPEDAPVLNWTIPFNNYPTVTKHSYRDNVWTHSSRVTFTPRFEDLDQPLRCTALFRHMGISAWSEIQLQLQYKPRYIETSLTVNGAADTHTMKEGDSVTVKCKALTSNPTVHDYTWFKKGTDVSIWSGQTLEFRRISYTDYGAYYCKASNRIGSAVSEDIQLQGQYAPRDFSIFDNANGEKVTGSIGVREKSKVNITCVSAKSDPAVQTYRWFKVGDTRYRSDNQILLLDSITKQDAGEYNCEAANEVGKQRSNSVTINVDHAPTNVRVDSLDTVKDGGYVDFYCQSDAYPPSFSFQWKKECDGFSSNACGDTSHCRLRVSVKDVSCNYYCTARNRIGEMKSQPRQLNVQYKPRNVKIVSKDTAQDGENVPLRCESDANPVASIIHWSKRCSGNDKQLPEKSPTIWIQIISVDEFCEYFCRAENDLGVQESQSKSIAVQYGPQNVSVVCSEWTGQVKEGAQVTLTCHSRSNPKPQYIWYKDSRDSSIEESMSNILVIEHVSLTDSGKYSCKVENSMGSITSAPIQIEVLYAPRNIKVLASPERDVIWEGDNITLVCNSESNPPVSSYKWSWNYGGETVTLPSSERNLTLSQVTAENEGLYFCEATNPVGFQPSKGHRIEVHKSHIKVVIIILSVLLFILLIVASAIVICRRRKSYGDSLSQQHIDVTNTVYSAVTKRSKSREPMVYENVVMTGSLENPLATPYRDNVEYASVNFTYQQPGDQQQHRQAARKKRNKEQKVKCDDDPSVIYSLVQKDPLSPKQSNDDYENVGNLYKDAADSSEDEVNYTSISHISRPGKHIRRQDSEESIEYSDIRF
ncbi:B-cell receptor CD22-like isoform X2 [Carcharodon carcharias]|uniref:B-cell receptor CD22-like isoform X2 n=1 Tax=Carcharodon carcharias TaxID=13397 RepID=UPI001B7DF6F5|nr:B-cell receptor CD22-like isoform X2 [Carcharodon carcharias]